MFLYSFSFDATLVLSAFITFTFIGFIWFTVVLWFDYLDLFIYFDLSITLLAITSYFRGHNRNQF